MMLSVKYIIPSYVVRQTKIAIILNIGFMVNGYTVAWSAPMIPILQSPENTPLLTPLTDVQGSWVGTIIFLAVYVTLLPAYLSNIFGRKPVLIINALIALIGYILLLTSKGLITLYLGRYVVSVSQTSSLVNSLVYVGEIASPNIRGIILTSTVLSQSLGGLLVMSVAPFVSYTTTQYIVIVIAIVYVMGIMFIPESPVYYMLKGNKNMADEIYKQLGRIDDTSKQEHETRNLQWRKLFATKSNRKSLLICSGLFTFQLCSGVIFIDLFTTNIFKNAASYVQPHIATICVGCTSVIGNLVSPLFVDKYGRKVLLFTSTVGCCLTLIVMGLYFYLLASTPSLIKSITWLPLLTLISFIFLYNLGLSSIPNTIIGEMFNSEVRTLGSYLTSLIAISIGFVCVTGTSYLDIAGGSHIVFWLYSLINLAALLFTVFVVPETKGKSLLEIEDMLSY